MATAVVCAKSTPTVTATGETLQHGGAFSYGAILVVWSWSRIPRDTHLVGFVGSPVDEARMMVRYEHLPGGTGKMSNALTRPPSACNTVSVRVLPYA